MRSVDEAWEVWKETRACKRNIKFQGKQRLWLKYRTLAAFVAGFEMGEREGVKHAKIIYQNK